MQKKSFCNKYKLEKLNYNNLVLKRNNNIFVVFFI